MLLLGLDRSTLRSERSIVLGPLPIVILLRRRPHKYAKGSSVHWINLGGIPKHDSVGALRGQREGLQHHNVDAQYLCEPVVRHNGGRRAPADLRMFSIGILNRNAV